MSAFLGPIHYWLYNKIKLQNDLTNRLMQWATSHGIEIEEELNEKYGVLPTESLEAIIDGQNIHGWLQEKVSLVEIRLADLVTTVHREKQELMESMMKEVIAFGNSIETMEISNLKELYKLLGDILLDGMPCDHVNRLISETETQITWKRTQCVHEKYWSQVGGDVQDYYNLRSNMIKGILLNTKFHYENDGEISTVTLN